MFQSATADFLRYLRFEKRYSAHTLEAYGNDLKQFTTYLEATYGISDPNAVTHFHLRSWLADMKNEQGLEPRSLNRKRSSIQSFYKFLLKQGIVTKNPVRQLHALKTPERVPQYLKESETDLLLGELQFSEGFKGFTERLTLELLYQCGLRRAELLNLKESDIEWGLRQIRVLGKGNKERLVPVVPDLLETLKLYIEAKGTVTDASHAVLLITEEGAPLYAMYVYRLVQKYLGAVSSLKKKSPHVLRHTFATHLLNNGANIQAIKELLGHSSLAATQVYTHAAIDALKEVHRRFHPRS